LKSVKIRALVDTNIFIYAYETPESNSSPIINALSQGLFEAIITESTFKEVYRYFRRHYLKSLADTVRIYLFAVCKIIFSHQLEEKSSKYTELINRKDLEQVIAVREYGIKYLVSYDEHFEDLEEYITPKQFVNLLGLKARPISY
jgi:predicted nucleic acid-binding protein